MQTSNNLEHYFYDALPSIETIRTEEIESNPFYVANQFKIALEKKYEFLSVITSYAYSSMVFSGWINFNYRGDNIGISGKNPLKFVTNYNDSQNIYPMTMVDYTITNNGKTSGETSIKNIEEFKLYLKEFLETDYFKNLILTMRNNSVTMKAIHNNTSIDNKNIKIND